MASVTFVIFTSAGRLADWLRKQTLDLPYKDFPTERGAFTLQTARITNRMDHIACESSWRSLSMHGSPELIYPVEELIYFDLSMLSDQPERLEVTAACPQRVIYGYFRDLLLLVAKRWPEAQEDLFPFLENLAAELGEYQAPPPGTPEARDLGDFVRWAMTGERQPNDGEKAMRIKITFQRESQVPKPTGGIAWLFPFLTVDSTLAGSPEEESRTSPHQIRVLATEDLVRFWAFPSVANMETGEDADRERHELMKVMFEYGKRYVAGRISRSVPLKCKGPNSLAVNRGLSAE